MQPNPGVECLDQRTRYRYRRTRHNERQGKLANGATTINVISNNFGYFLFPTTTIGVNYTATVTGKRYTFASQQINPSGNVTNLNFTALP